MEYFRKAVGHKFIDYLGPKNCNLMYINIKWDVLFYTNENRITTRIKKNSDLAILTVAILYISYKHSNFMFRLFGYT